ncbi:DNA-processing protein DprA [Ostreiculturibacter nitratireducens]|uniref:DNA-processing protein DprA n=1 Tax=Ostreiculturibacter nitratireducens TaxID=3075226 RepID=UPI0031B59135
MEKGLFSFTTPITPPTTEEDELSWLRLIRSRRVGATTFWRLLQEHGSAQDALNALPGIASAAGIEDYAPCPEGVALAELRAGRKFGARLIAAGQPNYPAALREIFDAPPLLWTLGDLTLLSRPMVALVGARGASSLGLRMARKLAGDLAAAGCTIVSGLARGIDAAAHTASLPATVAVQAGGVDVIYPAENAALAEEIGRKALRLSEQPIGLDPMARHFPLRNRIISGLARAVVVVEAAPKSGSLITAKNALDQGRDVMAVPGHPFDGRAGGCNALIREGATLVRGAEDVIATLGAAPAPGLRPQRPASPAAATAGTQSEAAPLHRQILDRLGPSPLAEDQLIRDLARPAAEVTEGLVTLELEGLIARQAGGLLARVT